MVQVLGASAGISGPNFDMKNLVRGASALVIGLCALTSVTADDLGNFRCPAPGMRISLSNGDVLTFENSNGFRCGYTDQTGAAHERYAVFVDAWGPLARAELTQLFPLLSGKNISFQFINEGTSPSDKYLRRTYIEAFSVVGQDSVTIQAGKFDTFVVEWRERIIGYDPSDAIIRFWYAPSVGYIVKSDAKILSQTGTDPQMAQRYSRLTYEATHIVSPQTTVASEITPGASVAPPIGPSNSQTSSEPPPPKPNKETKKSPPPKPVKEPQVTASTPPPPPKPNKEPKKSPPPKPVKEPQVTASTPPPPPASSAQSVPMQKHGNVYVVPVLINNAITLDFVVDSGASDVSIPADVVMTLTRAGTIRSSDFLGTQRYKLADGSEVPSQTFRIRSLKVGDRILENVIGSIAPVQGSLLLGQSFLGRFKSWSIDNSKHVLVLE